MRFVSKHRGYKMGIRPAAIGGYTPHGEPILTSRELIAEFRPGGLSRWEIDQALAHWNHFPGLAEGENPVLRLSWFDSDFSQRVHGWTDEEREAVEQKLLGEPNIGSDYIVIVPEKAQKPWGSYDKLSAPKQIVSLMIETGTDPEVVLRYERENGKRQEVLDAVEAAAAEAALEPAEQEVVVSA